MTKKSFPVCDNNDYFIMDVSSIKLNFSACKQSKRKPCKAFENFEKQSHEHRGSFRFRASEKKRLYIEKHT